MKILVVGNGGREHTIVWKLAQSPKVEEIYTAPGNAGTAMLGMNVDIAADEIESLLEFAQAEEIDLTVVGPEIPLMQGIVDRFEAEGLKIFGPVRQAAMLEGSKVCAKQLMTKYGIPTAPFVVCDTREEARAATHGKAFPYVIKVDGLAAGKGALIIKDQQDLETAFREIWDEKKFGTAAEQVLVEDFLQGEELSLFAVTDGERYVLLPAAQDHKRVFDNDEGPNTGGMGAYAPAPLGTAAVIAHAEEKVIRPLLEAMREEECPYKGVLYCGLMIDKGEPSVVEINARFGDPEAQVTIPLIRSDFADLLYSVADGKLDVDGFKLSDQYAACVIVASGGYPEAYAKGKIINGLDTEEDSVKDTVFLAGVQYDGAHFCTSGGRVLGVTRLAGDLDSAITVAYAKVKTISFDGAHYRRDIGKKGLARLQE